MVETKMLVQTVSCGSHQHPMLALEAVAVVCESALSKSAAGSSKEKESRAFFIYRLFVCFQQVHFQIIFILKAATNGPALLSL